MPVITGVVVLGVAGTVVATWRLGVVVDEAAGTDVVVTGIVEVVVVVGGNVSTDVVCWDEGNSCKVAVTTPSNTTRPNIRRLFFISEPATTNSPTERFSVRRALALSLNVVFVVGAPTTVFSKETIGAHGRN